MRSPSKASKAAYSRCPETCQKVRSEIADGIQTQLDVLGIDLPLSTVTALTDAAFDASLKYGTEKVRDALIDCEEELLEAREALDTAEEDARYERSRAASLQDEVAALQSELDNAHNS